MGDTDRRHEPSKSKSAFRAFLEVCRKFQELAASDESGFVPAWGGPVSLLKALVRRPFHVYYTLIREGYRSQTAVGVLVPYFPVEAMIAYLSRFTESELKSIKTLSEIELRRLKNTVTDNPILKVSVPIGSAYALLEASNKLANVHDPDLDSLRAMFERPDVQSFIASLLFIFIGGLAIVAFQYAFFILPTIGRAQILDDLLQIALEEKRFGATPTADDAAFPE